MQNLRYSANKGSDDAYDVSVSLTGYEPNFMAFSELNDSSGSFSYIIPSSDQDMDDATLGKLLTEAHRGQADYCEPEGVSVSQSSSSVVFDRAGKPAGERDVDQLIGFGVTRNTYSAHSKFSENTQAEKVVDRPGKPVGESSSNAQCGHVYNLERGPSDLVVKGTAWSKMTLLCTEPSRCQREKLKRPSNTMSLTTKQQHETTACSASWVTCASSFGHTLAGAFATAHCAGGAPRADHLSTNVHRTFKSISIPHTEEVAVELIPRMS